MLNRRQLIALGAGMTAAASVPAFVTDNLVDDPGPYAAAFDLLDRFVAQYLPNIGAPGLTLALADAAGVRRVACYGFDSLDGSRSLRPDQLFEIGSITKSFVALCLLQLRDEELSPEWVGFADPAAGRTMRLIVSGADFVRVMTA